MKKLILHTIDSNGTKGKCYTNEYELTGFFNITILLKELKR